MIITNYIDEIKYQICAANTVLLSDLNEFTKYHYFLIHCSIVHKILYPRNSKDDTDEQKNVKEQRKLALKLYFNDYDFLGDVELDTANKFRNHFEHIDTRIDDAASSNLILSRNIFIGTGPEELFGRQNTNKKGILHNFVNDMLIFHNQEFDIKLSLGFLKKIENFIESKK